MEETCFTLACTSNTRQGPVHEFMQEANHCLPGGAETGYNKTAVAAFRSYLRETYGAIQSLNAKWRTRTRTSRRLPAAGRPRVAAGSTGRPHVRVRAVPAEVVLRLDAAVRSGGAVRTARRAGRLPVQPRVRRMGVPDRVQYD